MWKTPGWLHRLLNLSRLIPKTLSIPFILEVYFLELYGKASEEKEVDKIVSKTREAKSTKAYDCIELIGRVLSFELFSPAVLEPEDHEWGLRAQIHAAATLKQRKRMEEMLRCHGLGLAANPSVTSKEMMLWVHELVSHYLPACVPLNKKSKLELKDDKRKQAQKHFGVGGGAVGEAGQKRSQLLEKRPEPAEKLPPMGPGVGVPCTRGCQMMQVSTLGDGESVSVNRNEYLLAELALILLHTCLKRETVDLKVKAHMEMLNPFVAVTQKLMPSKHDTVVVLVLKIFSLLLPLHLPATEEELPWALKNIFFLLQARRLYLIAYHEWLIQGSHRDAGTHSIHALYTHSRPAPLKPAPSNSTRAPRALLPALLHLHGAAQRSQARQGRRSGGRGGRSDKEADEDGGRGRGGGSGRGGAGAWRGKEACSCCG